MQQSLCDRMQMGPIPQFAQIAVLILIDVIVELLEIDIVSTLRDQSLCIPKIFEQE